MMKCSPPPAKSLSKYAPLIHVIKVKLDKINLIIGTGGKKVKSIIEESGIEAIDAEDDGTVKITAKDLSSLEGSKAIISNLTMVPTVGDIYRNCEIKSITPHGVFVEIAPGREYENVYLPANRAKSTGLSEKFSLTHPLSPDSRKLGSYEIALRETWQIKLNKQGKTKY